MNFQKLYDEGTPAQRAEFERRHAQCLKLAIAIKVVVLLILVVWLYHK